MYGDPQENLSGASMGRGIPSSIGGAMVAQSKSLMFRSIEKLKESNACLSKALEELRVHLSPVLVSTKPESNEKHTSAPREIGSPLTEEIEREASLTFAAATAVQRIIGELSL